MRIYPDSRSEPFKERADFAQVIGSIAGFGTDLSRMPEEEQRARLLKFLMETPCLLVWDNLEPVAGYPEGEPPLATDEERAKLSQFLKALRGAKSRVILTTRKPGENWLGVAYKLIELGGLSDRDVVELATEILKTVGRKPEEFKDDPEYSRLLKLLSGHPRSMEVVLRQLRNKTPSEIIEALQHRTGVLGEALEDASIGYAFSRLSGSGTNALAIVGPVRIAGGCEHAAPPRGRSGTTAEDLSRAHRRRAHRNRVGDTA